MPTATSLRAITMPSGVANWSRCSSKKCSGLCTEIEAWSCAWMLDGLLASRKLGLASFWSPANKNVTPMKTRSGSRAHPASAQPRGGGRNGEGVVTGAE